MDWDKLRIFHAVAEAGSFTHAGESLHLSQSAVSRQISALEESLGVVLFHRHARGLIPTEQGEMLFATAKEIFAKLATVEVNINESREKPAGALRVTTTVAFGSVWLTPRITEFLERYPTIEVSLVLADSELDLSMREADVAIRMSAPRQPGLIQRRLMSMHHHVYAAPEYIRRHGIPKTPADLDHHRIIVYGENDHVSGRNLAWLLDAGASPERPRKAVLRVNSVYGIFRAVQSGLGLGALPTYMTHEAHNLIQVLPELRGPSIDAFFVYAEELRNSKRISVFREFLVRKIGEAGL